MLWEPSPHSSPGLIDRSNQTTSITTWGLIAESLIASPVRVPCGCACAVRSWLRRALGGWGEHRAPGGWEVCYPEGRGRSGSVLWFDPGAPPPRPDPAAPHPGLSEDPRPEHRQHPLLTSWSVSSSPRDSGGGGTRKPFQPLRNFPSRGIGVSVTSNEEKTKGPAQGQGEPEGQAICFPGEDGLGEGGGFVSVESCWSHIQVEGHPGSGLRAESGRGGVRQQGRRSETGPVWCGLRGPGPGPGAMNGWEGL